MQDTHFIQQLIIQAPAFLFALAFHEFAHGYVAFLLGDHTAKNEGRLTLNPLKHLDPLGTIAIFLIKIGWAKPVPVNPVNFKNPRKDMLLVALAGPSANITLAVVTAIVIKIPVMVIAERLSLKNTKASKVLKAGTSAIISNPSLAPII